MKEINNFENAFCLDTNIVMDTTLNVRHLSENGKNVIIIPDTVTLELRNHKVGFDSINYNARVFNRFLGEAEVLAQNKNSILLKYIDNDEEVNLLLVKGNHDTLMLNDDRIVQVAKEIMLLYPEVPLTLISNDIDVRCSAMLEGVPTSILKLNVVEDIDFNFHKKIETDLEIKEGISISKLSETLGIEIPTSISSFEFINNVTGKRSYFTRQNGYLAIINENKLKLQKVNPINIPQKVFSSLILDESIDLVVGEALAGSGKNVISLSSSMRLLDTHKDKYNKIYYIRKSVPSVDKEAAIGYLKGSALEKLAGFSGALKDTLGFMVEHTNKKKKEKMTKEAIEEGVSELISDYNIEVLWEGDLRGRTLSSCIVIIDEASNFSKSSIQLILTRLGSDSKAIIIGSNRQIDSKYLNKHTNGLTHTLKLCCDTPPADVTLAGVVLEKGIRSNISAWADIAYE